MSIFVRGVCPLLQVFDMPTSIGFYRDTLGFTIVSTSQSGEKFDWAWLRLSGADLMLNTAYEEDSRPPAPVLARIAAHGDTVLYFDCPDVDAAYRHLQSQGMEVNPPAVAHYGMKQLHLRDPDGYELCFQCKVE